DLDFDRRGRDGSHLLSRHASVLHRRSRGLVRLDELDAVAVLPLAQSHRLKRRDGNSPKIARPTCMEVQPPPHLANARSALARWLRGGRTRASHESLRTTVAILRAQQEATLDGILVVDDRGSILSYNRRFLEMWGIPEQVAREADDNELLGFAS